MKHIKLFESFTDGPIFRFNQSELDQYRKEGYDYVTFYPARPGGSSFTIASEQDVRSMKEMLEDNDVRCMVGFGPYFHTGGFGFSGREAKSMVVILFNPEKDKEIVYDIIRRNFSLNYPTHQLGGW